MDWIEEESKTAKKTERFYAHQGVFKSVFPTCMPAIKRETSISRNHLGINRSGWGRVKSLASQGCLI